MFAPHNTTRGISLLATIHLIASTPGCNYYNKFPIEERTIADSLFVEALAPVNGTITVPEGPGLGIELDLEKMERIMDKVE